MRHLKINQVFLAVILSTTTIALSAIFLDYTGAIDMSFGGDWFKLKIESGEKQLPEANQSSDDAS